ncbi:MAG: DUF3987 domain-containing protein [Cyanobacteria bacterium SZAS LIN-3]|nr:DUF3987 domain-containing protein [Cyanobacteria bacterium SZAS LIN-3]
MLTQENNTTAGEPIFDDVERQPEAIMWEEPLLFGEIVTPPVTADVLPPWLRDYVRSVSACTQTPEGMGVMMALSVLATCLQRKFVISPKQGGYSEPLSLWTVTSLPPASRKSAVVGALTLPLQVWEKEQGIKMRTKIEEVAAERVVNDKRCEDLNKKAAKTDSTEQRRELLKEIAELKASTPDEMRPPQLYTGDVTPETLQSLLVDHKERMAVLSDEGGIFEVMAGLYSDGKVNLDVFLQGHAGSPVRVNRSQRSVTLERPALSFGLTVQPSVLADLGQGNKKRLRGNGCLARFLYLIPESNIGSRDVTRSTAVGEGLVSQYETNIRHLLAIEPDLDEQGKAVECRLLLTPEALASFQKFAQYVENNQGSGRDFEQIQDWTGKLPGAALRVAGLCHIAEYGAKTNLVGVETMERALDLCQSLIRHAEAAFQMMGADPGIDDAKYILAWLSHQGGDKFLKRDVHRLGRFKNCKVDRLHRALDVLIDRNIISGKHKNPATGKPTQYYYINPILVIKRK